jgi:hypothetical protein
MIASVITENDLVHEVHTSELRSYRGCRRRHDWSFNYDLQPKTTAVPLEFGVAFHAGMEAMYNPETWEAPRVLISQFAEAAFYDSCVSQRQKYNQQVDRGMDNDEERDYDKLVALGRGMIHWYVEKHLPIDEFVPIYVEEKFRVPITYLDGTPLMCKCDKCWMKYALYRTRELPLIVVDAERPTWTGLPVVYEGRVDVIVRDKYGNYWILDWKTTIRMMNEDSDVILELDDQIVGYVWALRRKLGLNIRGFKYVELKKGFPEPPKQNVHVRLGRAFSVSQSQDTDVDTFVQTVKMRDTQAYNGGLYDEFIGWLRVEGPKFIQHHTVRKTEVQLDNFAKNMLGTVLEMINPATALYPSPGRFSCGFCGYREPCLDKESGGDYQYALDTMYEVKPRYYALREATTDHKGIG